MRKINIILCLSIFISIIFINCEGDKRKITNLLDSSDQTIESNEQPETLKQVEWKDGNSYSYDHTEVINYIDRAGETHQVTVYKVNQPTNVQCDSRTCKWCSKQYTAEDYSIEEYPNISWMSKLENEMSWSELSEAASVYEFIIKKSNNMWDEEKANLFDLENNRVRLEFKTTCNYKSLDFCSLKCENEYQYR